MTYHCDRFEAIATSIVVVVDLRNILKLHVCLARSITHTRDLQANFVRRNRHLSETLELLDPPHYQRRLLSLSSMPSRTIQLTIKHIQNVYPSTIDHLSSADLDRYLPLLCPNC